MQTAPMSGLVKYRERMFKPTSRKDLQYMLNDKVKILTYDQLNQYNTFKELIEPYQSLVILYPNADDPDVGHWTCIFVVPGTTRVEYFDSYGSYIDEPIGEYNSEMKALHERQRIEPKLLELLSDSPYADNVYWNETPFQSETQATQTCGLWCVVRLKNNYMTETEFEKIWYDMPTNEGMLPDLLVATVICDMFPEMA